MFKKKPLSVIGAFLFNQKYYFTNVKAINVKGEFHTSVYPNPSNGKGFLIVDSQPKKPLNIRIYDNTGKVIQDISNVISGSRIDTKNLSNGIYLFKIWNADFLINQKVIIE